jgi:L-histidine N-alpha-methyltransferase
MPENFKNDVLEGLSLKPQKKLSSKYFYDAAGDELFVKIMAMPEYYLTRAEMDIFQNKTDELIAALRLNKSDMYDVIELGAGDGTKTIHLLKEMLAQNFEFEYYPVDISQNALTGLTEMLSVQLPGLIVKPMNSDYFDSLKQLKQDGRIKIIFFLGSNIGNLPDELATEFIYQLGSNLFSGDRIILGVDLIKPKEIVLPAYADAKGITAEFNINLLRRINRELSANFNIDEFEHYPVYEEEEGIAKSYIRSKIEQTVTINGNEFQFAKGELIHTEVSRKYNDAIIKNILSKTDITWEEKIMDSNNLFADYILIRH